jgi:hypothetical protein
MSDVDAEITVLRITRALKESDALEAARMVDRLRNAISEGIDARHRLAELLDPIVSSGNNAISPENS